MPADSKSTPAPGDISRRLIRTAGAATLATAERDHDGRPYASLVECACGQDASPILLLSDLADHTKNIAKDDRVSLLYDGTAPGLDRLAGMRVTVQGRACRLAAGPRKDALAGRYLARHPGADAYADFGDFNFYEVTPERAHLIGGFGEIHWLIAESFLYDTGTAAALSDAEPEILEHMNADHADAVQLYAALAQSTGTGWRLCGIDPEGIDLAQNGRFLRIDFEKPVLDPSSARARLAALAKQGRRESGHKS
ncbi:MAG: pyridoxamine 5'-phosphate oxidase family protein [Alphaproteobacteria bacterium]|nr:pyridoxamine 5'-phosphate oxidase family protein [Alphaproteobacteria bacterium]